MSNLVGAFYFDERPVGVSEQAWVRDTLVQLDPSGGVVDLNPGLVAGHAASALDRSRDNGRFVGSDGSICLWDGRLDNRQDLAMQFGQIRPGRWTDSALALRLFQTRGTEGLRDLIGDWSLVIWDASSRTLVLASDYAGVRPLYYHCAPGRILWSSSLSSLVCRTGVTELDQEYVASFLTQAYVARRTPYRGILPVPPGHAVYTTGESVSTRAFWDLPIDQEIRFQDERSYEEGLRALFREAVAVRLATDSPVCAELSGGLDSSSVVCMASHIAAERGAGASNLVTLSYTHSDCADERYFRAVERARNLSGVHLDLEQIPFVTARQTGQAAPGWWEPRFTQLALRMAEMESGVLLTGQLGDCIMGNTIDDGEQVVDFLERRQWVGAAREAFAWSRSLQVSIYSILWRALRSRHSAWTASPTSANPARIPGPYAHVDSMTRDFHRRAGRNSSDGDRGLGWQAAGPGRRRRFRALSEMLQARLLQVPEALQHISYTHPFAHRPLVEFMLTIPPAVVCRPGEPRRLMRRAFTGLLPDSVRNRKSKAAYGGVYRQALLPLAAEMLREPGKMRLAEHGFVDRDSVTERLTAFTRGLDSNEGQLRQIILLEFWLRNRERPCSSAPLPESGSLALALSY
jgi:asparagine synthase (glutamine-hydrolysing)